MESTDLDGRTRSFAWKAELCRDWSLFFPRIGLSAREKSWASKELASAALQDGAPSIVVESTPQQGGRRARILFQVLLDSARESILITTPYFLPHRSARRALLRAIRERGVLVRIFTKGRKSDHPTITKLGRSLELELLRAGAEIYEYQPGMIHAKLMVIDQQWSVLAKFDHRPFALNNEVNMAVLDRSSAAQLWKQMQDDVAQSQRVTVGQLRNLSLCTNLMDDLNLACAARRVN